MWHVENSKKCNLFRHSCICTVFLYINWWHNFMCQGLNLTVTNSVGLFGSLNNVGFFSSHWNLKDNKYDTVPLVVICLFVQFYISSALFTSIFHQSFVVGLFVTQKSSTWRKLFVSENHDVCFLHSNRNVELKKKRQKL